MAETPLAVDVLNVQSSPGPLFEPDGSLPKISNVPRFASRHVATVFVPRCREEQSPLQNRLTISSDVKRRIGGLVNNV